MSLDEKILDPLERQYPITVGYNQLYKYGIHKAIDWATPNQTPLLAAISGKVDIGYGILGGDYISIKNGKFEVTYRHIKQPYLYNGNNVIAGTDIGLSGGVPGERSSGLWCTGPHTHFELKRYGEFVNPLNYIMPMQELKNELAKEVLKEVQKKCIEKDKRFVYDPNRGETWIIDKGFRYCLGRAKDDWKITESKFCIRHMTRKDKNLPKAKSRDDVL